MKTARHLMNEDYTAFMLAWFRTPKEREAQLKRYSVKTRNRLRKLMQAKLDARAA